MIQESNNKKQLGTVDEFHTKSCYKLYMYAVSLAKQVNEYIDRGWLVLYKGKPLKKFVFYSINSPCIGGRDGNCTIIWIEAHMMQKVGFGCMVIIQKLLRKGFKNTNF